MKWVGGCPERWVIPFSLSPLPAGASSSPLHTPLPLQHIHHTYTHIHTQCCSLKPTSTKRIYSVLILNECVKHLGMILNELSGGLSALKLLFKHKYDRKCTTSWYAIWILTTLECAHKQKHLLFYYLFICLICCVFYTYSSLFAT